MGWNVSVYARSVKDQCEKLNQDAWDYLEDEKNLAPFSEVQLGLIEAHLGKRGYQFVSTSKSVSGSERKNYEFQDASMGIQVFLTASGLYFSSPNAGTMEISMTSSEFFTDSAYDKLGGEFSVFDPQNGGWL